MAQLDIITKHLPSFARLMRLIMQPTAASQGLGGVFEARCTNPFVNCLKSKQVRPLWIDSITSNAWLSLPHSYCTPFKENGQLITPGN